MERLMVRIRRRLSKQRAYFATSVEEDLAAGVDLSAFRTKFGRFVAEGARLDIRHAAEYGGDHLAKARRTLDYARDTEIVLREAYGDVSHPDHAVVFVPPEDAA
jgi:hypothetical protein